MPININSEFNFHKAIASLEAKVTAPVEGYFGPKSMTWHCYKNPVMVFGALRALLLQLCHPAVSEGVRKYSNFRSDSFGRIRRTFHSMHTIFFGNTKNANRIAMGLHHMHSGIKSTTNKKAFTAIDPELLLWVQATLVEATFYAFETGGIPLREDEKEQFFEESKITATLMGIPPDVYPQNLAAFNKYFDKMIKGDELVINKVTQEIVDAVFHIPYTITSFNKLIAKATLPSPIRNDFGWELTKNNCRVFRWLKRLFSLITGCLPNPLLNSPAYHLANYRIARANNKRGSIMGWLYLNLLPRFMKV